MLKYLSALKQRITLAAWKVVSRKWFAEKERGQALSEYGVIIGVVVGIVVVAVVISFRGQIVAAFQAATNALSSAR
jgi:Flp pilus assembly pilin Flp